MVESVIETNDKEVGSHPCAVCASDPQGGPHSGCDEFQCSGCQKPEQFEAKELGFDEQDAIIQQAKLDKIEKRNAEARTMSFTYKDTLQRLLADIAKASCPGDCTQCGMRLVNNEAVYKITFQ